MGRKFLPTEDRKDLLQKLKNVHKDMAKDIAIRSLTPTELAERYGYTKLQVSRIINSPVFQNYTENLRSEIWEELKSSVMNKLHMLTEDALKIIEECLTTDGIPISSKLKAALEVLDRTGFHQKSDLIEEHKHLHVQSKIDVKNMSTLELRDYLAQKLKDTWK